MLDSAPAIIDIEEGDTGLVRIRPDTRLPGMPILLSIEVSGVPTEFVTEPLVEAWLSRDSAMKLVDLLLKTLNPPEAERSVAED